VTVKGGAWELYNLAEDRTELHDVAAAHPEVLERMVRQWHDMAASVLHAPAKEREPVAETATPRQNKRWSNYTAAPQNDQFQGEKRR
jgi:arylsulfatase